MKTVHFVRHGETDQNKDGIWQGHTNTQLSKTGKAQAKLLSKRINLKNQTVFTSDLARAKETAYLLSDSPNVRENLREKNVGDFTGKSVKETYSNNLDIFDALQYDTYVFPNGESVQEFKLRVQQEVDHIFDSIDEDSECVVVTHGFFIGTAIGLVLGFNQYPYPIGNIQNTSISTVIKRDSVMQVNKFNDAIHLPNSYIDYPAKDKSRILTFIRHGQTDSNTQGVWQGHVDNPLNTYGVETAKQLKGKFSNYDLYLSSSFKRALETISLIVDDQDITATNLLAEMDLGRWEGLSTSEIMENYRENFIQSLFINFRVKYGIDGESMNEAGIRVRDLLNDYDKAKMLVASHGGTIKAAITTFLNCPEHKAASSFTIPNNLGVSCLEVKDNKYSLWSYNVGKIGYENISYNE